MLFFHRTWFVVVVVANLAPGIWGLAGGLRRKTMPRAFWIAIIAGQVALAVQVVAGVILFQTRKPSGQHVFYGFMLLFVSVMAWAFRGTGSTSRRAVLVMASVAMFIGVVAVRAALTA